MENVDLKEVVVLEDGQEYYIMNRIVHNKAFCVLLANVHDVKDLIVQKEKIDNGKVVFEGVSSKEEFEQIIKIFANQNIY